MIASGKDKFKMIVIGTSQGGYDALKIILGSLPKDFPVPILIVRHQKPDTDDYIIKSLGKISQLKISFATEGEKPLPGKVYLAPPDRHLLVNKYGNIVLSEGKSIHFSRPAIDPLFETAAACYGSKLVAIILTGANSDGAIGVKTVKAHGGIIIVQDPESSEARAMPDAAIRSVNVDHKVWLTQIGPFLWSLTRIE